MVVAMYVFVCGLLVSCCCVGESSSVRGRRFSHRRIPIQNPHQCRSEPRWDGAIFARPHWELDGEFVRADDHRRLG